MGRPTTDRPIAYRSVTRVFTFIRVTEPVIANYAYDIEQS